VDTVVNDFGGVLRAHHLKVSSAESIDALQALKHTGLGERESDMPLYEPLCDRVEVGEHPVEGLEREELGVEVEENPVLLATHTYGPDGVCVLAVSFLAR